MHSTTQKSGVVLNSLKILKIVSKTAPFFGNSILVAIRYEIMIPDNLKRGLSSPDVEIKYEKRHKVPHIAVYKKGMTPKNHITVLRTQQQKM